MPSETYKQTLYLTYHTYYNAFAQKKGISWSTDLEYATNVNTSDLSKVEVYSAHSQNVYIFCIGY